MSFCSKLSYSFTTLDRDISMNLELLNPSYGTASYVGVCADVSVNFTRFIRGQGSNITL
jgi:hypothetical protein